MEGTRHILSEAEKGKGESRGDEEGERERGKLSKIIGKLLSEESTFPALDLTQKSGITGFKRRVIIS